MKRIALAALLASTVVSASAQVYVGGAFGPSRVNVECGGLLNCDSSDTGYKFYAGYKVNPIVALEAAYVDFGKAKFTGGSFAVDGFLLNAALRHNFTRQLNGVARLGVAVLDTKLSGPLFINSSDSSTKLYFGLGLEYAFAKNLKGTASLDFANAEFKGESGSVRMLNVGAQYDF